MNDDHLIIIVTDHRWYRWFVTLYAPTHYQSNSDWNRFTINYVFSNSKKIWSNHITNLRTVWHAYLETIIADTVTSNIVIKASISTCYTQHVSKQLCVKIGFQREVLRQHIDIYIYYISPSHVRMLTTTCALTRRSLSKWSECSQLYHTFMIYKCVTFRIHNGLRSTLSTMSFFHSISTFPSLTISINGFL